MPSATKFSSAQLSHTHVCFFLELLESFESCYTLLYTCMQITSVIGFNTHKKMGIQCFFKTSDGVKGKAKWCRQLAIKAEVMHSIEWQHIQKLSNAGYPVRCFTVCIDEGKAALCDVDLKTWASQPMEMVDGRPAIEILQAHDSGTLRMVRDEEAEQAAAQSFAHSDSSKEQEASSSSEGEDFLHAWGKDAGKDVDMDKDKEVEVEVDSDATAEEEDLDFEAYEAEEAKKYEELLPKWINMPANCKLPKLKRGRNMHTLKIMRNGGTSFIVYVKVEKGKRYARVVEPVPPSNWDWEQNGGCPEEECVDVEVMPWKHVKRVLCGRDSGKLHADGISVGNEVFAVLLDLGEGKYMQLEDYEITTFTHHCKIVRYIADLGLDHVVQGHAVDEEGNIVKARTFKDAGDYLKPENSETLNDLLNWKCAAMMNYDGYDIKDLKQVWAEGDAIKKRKEEELEL